MADEMEDHEKACELAIPFCGITTLGILCSAQVPSSQKGYHGTGKGSEKGNHSDQGGGATSL